MKPWHTMRFHSLCHSLWRWQSLKSKCWTWWRRFPRMQMDSSKVVQTYPKYEECLSLSMGKRYRSSVELFLMFVSLHTSLPVGIVQNSTRCQSNVLQKMVQFCKIYATRTSKRKAAHRFSLSAFADCCSTIQMNHR